MNPQKGTTMEPMDKPETLHTVNMQDVGPGVH